MPFRSGGFCLKTRAFFCSGMVGPTDQETAAIEDTVTPSSQEEGAGHALGGGGGHGEAPASVRKQRWRGGNVGQSPRVVSAGRNG